MSFRVKRTVTNKLQFFSLPIRVLSYRHRTILRRRLKKYLYFLLTAPRVCDIIKTDNKKDVMPMSEKTPEQIRQESIEQLKGLRPIDDIFMREMFRNNIELTQFVLRTIY